MSGNHDHSHNLGPDHRKPLAVVLGITVTVMLVEVVGAAVTGSLALLADSGHMLTDVAGLTMALVAAALSRRPPTPSRTWGFLRVEILSAAAQALLLFGVGIFILIEAVRRLLEPPGVATTGMIVFGLIGLGGNIIGMLILYRSRQTNLNMRAAFLEVVNDALGSVAVLAAAVVIAATGFERADAIASLIVVALIVPRTVRIGRDALHVLLESTPPGLNLAAVRTSIQGLAHVHDVHDLHATQIATGVPVLTAHVVVDDSCFHDGHLMHMLDQVQTELREAFAIEHTTIQFETVIHSAHEYATHD